MEKRAAAAAAAVTTLMTAPPESTVPPLPAGPPERNVTSVEATLYVPLSTVPAPYLTPPGGS